MMQGTSIEKELKNVFTAPPIYTNFFFSYFPIRLAYLFDSF